MTEFDGGRKSTDGENYDQSDQMVARMAPKATQHRTAEIIITYGMPAPIE